MAKFKGSQCLTGDCGGHRAGFKYANQGGGLPSKYSPSFNNGMKIAQGTFETPAAKAKRLAANKKRRLKKQQNLLKKATTSTSPVTTGLLGGVAISLTSKQVTKEDTDL
tara:strand:+ start:262 stop:588 length:327 start_codon:yes stop_codon:yes gene_type:complete